MVIAVYEIILHNNLQKIKKKEKKMDFFNLLVPELGSPCGVLVKTGTDPLLLSSDWSKNLELCDYINQHPEEG